MYITYPQQPSPFCVIPPSTLHRVSRASILYLFEQDDRRLHYPCVLMICMSDQRICDTFTYRLLFMFSIIIFCNRPPTTTCTHHHLYTNRHPTKTETIGGTTKEIFHCIVFPPFKGEIVFARRFAGWSMTAFTCFCSTLFLFAHLEKFCFRKRWKIGKGVG